MAVWDLRKLHDFKQPVAVFEEPKQIKKIQYCPARYQSLSFIEILALASIQFLVLPPDRTV